jgi:hypothetical protein
MTDQAIRKAKILEQEAQTGLKISESAKHHGVSEAHCRALLEKWRKLKQLRI